jgi:hypothetical protein
VGARGDKWATDDMTYNREEEETSQIRAKKIHSQKIYIHAKSACQLL